MARNDYTVEGVSKPLLSVAASWTGAIFGVYSLEGDGTGGRSQECEMLASAPGRRSLLRPRRSRPQLPTGILFVPIRFLRSSD